ncbi:four-carbon acid sugar kinase family protein [Pseudomonas sp. CBS]|uniref:four-carbon acid sugar kinase family protein n=1 Tax=Pseudomonas sp. CBS TaxID=2971912 RepID=UPI0021AC72FA|nr:four-carbon acid sugar kinase family protein [Pseudomonas sp. CBS]WEL64576.1 four-carbon acid sugar kinase family protein [Pseudomonas sp. CBSPGW29]WEL68046.1 four-carbon acid sugar kinase family protein [Pseudomonas sp. CBSPCGW29]WEL75066.1 four-carbon acid sugar kinase family protein [Pseudomonas sp. CBSPAW29]WEL80688.1 four-carbon acid sugar kinase family protein [Pseudomonas sp. CBSPCAW29]UVH51861.1 four-carbon acid sugar kinase family protein [Pseudomonas sp. CBS]
MSTVLLIVADDLSGAADCAAGFAAHVSTVVAMGAQPAAQGALVLAVDLDSRRLPAAHAAELHRALLSRPGFATLALYKKIDSTLRGNVAAEVRALQASRGLALVAPALPAMGRTTVGGVQHLHGTPVDQTDVWRNEGLQGTADLVASLRGEQLRCATVDLITLRDPIGLAECLAKALMDGTQALVCDAETDADLRQLAHCSAPLRDRLFWVGSAGLAAHLPQALALSPAQNPIITAGGPVLCVVGSMSRHSRDQAHLLVEKAGLYHLEVSAATLLEPGQQDARRGLALKLLGSLSEGRDAVLTLSQTARDPAQAAALSHALAAWLQPVLSVVGSLIATGGETARALLGSAGIERLDVAGELAPGVVLSRSRYHHRDLNIVTKAGAFGQPDTLLRAWQQLRAPAGSAPNYATSEEINHV